MSSRATSSPVDAPLSQTQPSPLTQEQRDMMHRNRQVAFGKLRRSSQKVRSNLNLNKTTMHLLTTLLTTL